MTTKRILFSIINVVVSIGFVCLIWYSSRTNADNAGDFSRLLPPQIVQSLDVKDLKLSGLYIAGLTNQGDLYLAQENRPGQLIKMDLRSMSVDTLTLHYHKADSLFRGCFMIVDSTDVYVLDGIQPAIYKASLSKLKSVKLPKPPYFSGAVLNGNTFLMRCVVSEQNVLMKYSIADGKTTPAASPILMKQVDGIFCTDGNMTSAPGGLIYSYFYRNQFLRVDSMLKVKYTGNTIDTNTRADIEVKSIFDGKEITMVKQPQFVNQQSAANSKYIFIRSALRADNEGGKVSENAAVIDVYNLETGKYKHSFYLPYFNKQKLTDFRVSEDRLVALFGSYVCTFKLSF